MKTKYLVMADKWFEVHITYNKDQAERVKLDWIKRGRKAYIRKVN